KWALPRLQEPDEAGLRLRKARPKESRQSRLAARDLRLSAARGGEAAAQMALSDHRQPRDGARGRAIDAGLDGERGGCGGSRISCGRAPALTPRWKPAFPSRSRFARSAEQGGCDYGLTT